MKNILVYGGNSFIGDSLIQRLTEQSDLKIVTVGSTKKCDYTYEEFYADCELAFDAIAYTTGRPQVPYSSIDENPELFDKNTFEFFRLIEHLEQKALINEDCSIVYVSSGHSVRASDVNPYYAASKSAVNSFVLSYSKKLAKLNKLLKGTRRINAVAPEAIDSPMITTSIAQDANISVEGYIASRPNFRLLHIDEVINVMEFLLSDKSTGLNGTTMVLGGIK